MSHLVHSGVYSVEEGILKKTLLSQNLTNKMLIVIDKRNFNV